MGNRKTLEFLLFSLPKDDLASGLGDGDVVFEIEADEKAQRLPLADLLLDRPFVRYRVVGHERSGTTVGDTIALTQEAVLELEELAQELYAEQQAEKSARAKEAEVAASLQFKRKEREIELALQNRSVEEGSKRARKRKVVFDV